MQMILVSVLLAVPNTLSLEIPSSGTSDLMEITCKLALNSTNHRVALAHDSISCISEYKLNIVNDRLSCLLLVLCDAVCASCQTKLV